MFGMTPRDTFFMLCMAIVFGFPVLGRAWKQLMRTVRVWDRGWPPPHLDADGDFVDMLEDEA